MIIKNKDEFIIAANRIFESVDREDIINLFQNDMFTLEDFRETAEEAKNYYSVADPIRSVNLVFD